MLIKKVCILCTVLLCVLKSTAQLNNFQFSRLDINNGLSSNQVNAILKDSKGFLWIGTLSGLNRYDGYSLKIFKHNPKDSLSISDEYIISIGELDEGKLLVETRNGFSLYDPLTESFTRNTDSYFKRYGISLVGVQSVVKTKNGYWLLYQQGGLLYYEHGKPVIRLQHTKGDPGSIEGTPVTDLKADSKGNVLLVHNNGVMEELNPSSFKVTARNSLTTQITNQEPHSYNIFLDADDDAWIYAEASSEGVYFYQRNSQSLKHFSKDAANRLTNNVVNAVVQDNNGLIWVGTDHGGINVIDKKTLKSVVLQNKEDDNKSLSENSVNSMFKDNLGIVWVGTFKKGISYYCDYGIKFPLYSSANTAGLHYEDVNRFVEDAKGNLWIGTNGGGLIYFNRLTNSFIQYKHNPLNKNSIGNDVVVSLCIDHEGKLWIGSYYGGLDCFDGNSFIHFKHNSADPGSISDDRVWEIYEDSDKVLWIGTLAGGLDRFDRQSKKFTHFNTGTKPLIHSNYISCFAEDKQKRLWISTAFGIEVMDRERKSFTYYSSADDGLSNDNVNFVLCDRDNNIWVGTREGLNVFLPASQKFQQFRTEDGLPDNTILHILEGDDGYLWTSTTRGLSRIKASKQKDGTFKISCRNYDERDGLQGRIFNDNAGLKTRKGELIFGGPYGFNIFLPSGIRTDKNIPPVVFTDLQVFNKSVSIGGKSGKRVLLPQSISTIQEITLPPGDNVFSLEFAALSYVNTEKNNYAYMLEGFNKNWINTDGRNRKVTYTNMDPGTYTFRVKATNSDGVWNESAATIKVTILPPFWKTPLAYLLYVVVLAGILWFSRHLIVQRTRMRFEIEQQKMEAQRMHELDLMKTRFFTNVSHEFRTPLSLILAPLDKMISHAEQADQKKQYQLIHRNARRLLNLVNQLLDFRKMEVQELKLNPTKGDIIKFVREISYSFTDIAEKKNISFAFASSVDQLHASFDHNKVERILFNLLSNAFKFTLENGSVNVQLNLKKEKESEKEYLVIIIKDNGIGIPQEKKEKIFERYFQNEIPGSMVNQGSGIGLAITKEFIRMQDGTIEVESEPGKGSEFTITLPVTIVSPQAEVSASFEEDLVGNGAPVVKEPLHTEAEQGGNTARKPVILLVEDNEDFLFYLKDNLRMQFTIIEADNGREGWQKTLAHHPDLVVSDISMPEMSGTDLCKKIKKDPRTSHTPVILLTALTGEEQQLRGLETGANDYMTKPFNFEILQSRIKNILDETSRLRKTFQKKVAVQPADINLASPDEQFIFQALEVVEKNIANAEFSVEDLSRAMFISRVGLYKKLLALTGKTPLEFIRSIRMNRATQLLEKSQMTVSEIAYEVGFNSPKNFSRTFKAVYNVIPSEYAERVRKSESP